MSLKDFVGKLGSSVSSGVSGSLGSIPGQLVSGGLGQMFDAIAAKRDWKYTQKEMALQQQYNLETMAKEQEYALENWNRQNEYNDPRNVVSRFRSAGIAPQAVFGSGAQGAGVAGSTAATPSGSAPNASRKGGRPSFMPVMTLAESMAMENQKRLTDADVNLKNAEAENVRAKTADQLWQNSMQSVREAVERFGLDKAKSEAFIAEYEAIWAPIRLMQESQQRDEAINKAKAETQKIGKEMGLTDQLINESIARSGLIKEQTETEKHKQNNYDSDSNLKNEQAMTEWYRRQFLDKNAKLVDAQTEEAKKRMEKMDKEIDQLVAKKLLTDEQAKYVRQMRKLAWAKFGVDVARSISSELRAWLGKAKDMSASGWADVDLDAIAPVLTF